jgi:hypothetical protein
MDSPSSGTVNWFYVQEGRRRGPFERAELLRQLLSLEAPEGTLVWRTGLGAWTKAGLLDDLKRELPPPLPGALSLPAGGSPQALPELPADTDAQASGAPVSEPSPDPAKGGTVADGDLVNGTDDGEGPPGESAAQRRRRRRHRKPRTGGLPSFVVPLVLLLLAMALGLWFLLRRINEVPPGRIIQQGDSGVPSPDHSRSRGIRRTMRSERLGTQQHSDHS